MAIAQYIGRFAPSPTGPMHFGTLIAAVGSYLQAKTNQGQWLIRMEDVDTTRVVEDSDTQLLNSLEAFGFEWDSEVIYQTTRNVLYSDALERLNQQHLIYPCTCSRKHLASHVDYKKTGVYPGTCREQSLPFQGEHALRLKVSNTNIRFDDMIMGPQQENLATECGDFVIKRKEGLFAYQLAAVVDDASQGITEIVRGADLLDSTARQIYLQQLLGYKTPTYIHLPLALGDDGNKLSKQSESRAIDNNHPTLALVDALSHLGQQPPESLKNHPLDDIWTWAIQHWDIKTIPQQNKRV